MARGGWCVGRRAGRGDVRGVSGQLRQLRGPGRSGFGRNGPCGQWFWRWLTDATATDRSGRVQSGEVADGSAVDTAVLAPWSGTAAGQKMLLTRLRGRLVEQQQVIAYKARDARLAALLRSVGVQLSHEEAARFFREVLVPFVGWHRWAFWVPSWFFGWSHNARELVNDPAGAALSLGAPYSNCATCMVRAAVSLSSRVRVVSDPA